MGKLEDEGVCFPNSGHAHTARTPNGTSPTAREDAPNRMERGGVGIGGMLGGNNRLRHELTSEFKHWEKSSPPARPHDICALKKEKKKKQTKTFFSLVTDYGFLQLFFKF